MSNTMLNTRLLRSNCRSHGSGCSCPTQELPTTPRRSRSMSKTPSRASSVAPELCLSSEPIPSIGSPNGISRHLDFQSNNENVSPAGSNSSYYQSQSQRRKTSGHYMESISQSVQQNFLDVETSSRSSQSRLHEDDRLSSHSRSSRYKDDGRMSQLQLRLQDYAGTVSASPSRSERERSYSDNNQRMVKMFNVDEGDETLIETDLHDSSSTFGDCNGSMALSHSSSAGSNSAYETRSRILMTSSSKKTTTTSTSSTVKNGSLLGMEYSLSNNVADLYNKSNRRSKENSSHNHSSIVTVTSGNTVSSCSSYVESRLQSAASHLLNAVMFVPRLTYWSLVNLFVVEKWLLHRSSAASSSLLKSVLPLVLFLLLGMCLYSFLEYLPQYWERPAKLPTFTDVPHEVPEWQPPPAPTSCPQVTNQNAEYDRLLEKISELERTAEVYRATAEETYNNRLNLLNEDWELKLQKEILKLEPSTMTIVEKHVHDVEYEKLVEKIAILERAAEDYRKSAEENYNRRLKILTEQFELKIHEEILKIEPTTTIIQQSETIVSPPTQPEPLDHDKLSSMLMPLILPLVMEKVKSQVDTLQKDCPDNTVQISSETERMPTILGTAGFHVSDVEKMIRAAIAKYDADKTGLPDLALESAGGTILSTRCTKSSQSKNSVLTLWGWRVWSFSNSPRSIIQPGVVPGECWVVEGATAEVVIQLISPAVITGFTLEHIPKAISPYGKIDTAPKKFQVMGLMSENDLESVWDYGTFVYLDNDEPIQYFTVQNKTETAYPIVELRILSNHGSVKSTCIYRFRVHGVMMDMRT